MDGRTVLSAAGAGVTTFLLVTVAVIELLAFEFSALIGLPVGFVAGVLVLVGLLTGFDGLRPGVRRAVSAYAVFGLTVLVLFTLRYVNIGRDVLSVDVLLVLGAGAAVLVYILLWLTE